MTTRKFRLIIQRNNQKFSDNASVVMDIRTSFIADTSYTIYELIIPKWMEDMLGKDDFKLLETRIDDLGETLYKGYNGMELHITLY
jgi:hypothetical protein